MNWDELIAVVEEAGFDWAALGIRDRMCFEKLVALVAEKTAAKERECIFGSGRQLDGQMRLQLTRWEDGECFAAAAHFTSEQTHFGVDDLLLRAVERLDDNLDACIAAAIRAKDQKGGQV